MYRIRMLAVVCVLAVGIFFSQMPAALAEWATITLDNYGTADQPSTSLVVGPTGRTFVAFTRSGDDLIWAKKTPDGWTKTKIRGTGTVGIGCYNSERPWAGPSAGFDANDRPMIASACMAVGGGAPVYLTRRMPRGWKDIRVGTGPAQNNTDSSISSLALAVTPGGKPHVVSTDAGTLSIVRFRRVDGRWRRQTLVAGTPGSYRLLDAEFDPLTGNLGVAWTTRVDDVTSIAYAEFDREGDLVGEIQDPFGEAGETGMPVERPSLAFRENGDPVIAVAEQGDTSTFLVIAERTPGDVWGVTRVDDATSSDVGENPSLLVIDDIGFYAYEDRANGDLVYLVSGDWAVFDPTSAATTGAVGGYPSLGITPTGGVRISHYDAGATALRFTSGA